jgi:hypothetical protein
VVCGSIFPYQAAPVQAKNDGKILKSHIMNDLVICPLKESGIYVAKRKIP